MWAARLICSLNSYGIVTLYHNWLGVVENNSEHYLELSYYVTYVLLDHVCNLGRVACWIRTS